MTIMFFRSCLHRSAFAPPHSNRVSICRPTGGEGRDWLAQLMVRVLVRLLTRVMATKLNAYKRRSRPRRLATRRHAQANPKQLVHPKQRTLPCQSACR